MIGKVKVVVDNRPHCMNGWRPEEGEIKRPACNYCKGHFCDLLADHDGLCQCICGATHKRRVEVMEDV